ncbi:MAG: hypothetical protein KGI97_04050 [Alphaproteobacteria bacterium]|nr:hypothetical protein [Alphaproteobacteria bacterium]
MEWTSVHDAFRLSDVRQGFVHALPYDPLKLVVAEDDKPQIIVCYDYCDSRRVVRDVPRPAPQCTHVFVVVVPGDGRAPVYAGFNAACLSEYPADGKYKRLHPERRREAYHQYEILSRLSPLQKVLHPNLKNPVDGEVTSDVRYGDVFASAKVGPAQIAATLDYIKAQYENPQPYRVRARRGEGPNSGINCGNFVADIVRVAGVLPLTLGPPWPGMHARIIDGYCGGDLRRVGNWLLQPREVTAAMHAAALETAVPFGKPVVPVQESVTLPSSMPAAA